MTPKRFFGLLLGLWIWGAGTACLMADTPPADIRIVVGAPGPNTLTPELFGSNLQWTGRGDGLRPGQAYNPGAPVIDLLKSWLQPPVVRFPGGLMASRYIWADGVTQGLPMEKNRLNDFFDPTGRPPGYNFVGEQEPMVFGSAEYLALLSRLGARGMITVNLNERPEKVSDWLVWLTQWSRAMALEPQPELPWWEIGNESYFNDDPSHVTPSEYVNRYRQHKAALNEAARRVGVDIKVGAILDVNLRGVTWLKYVAEHQAKWNEVILDGLGSAADFFIIHLYAPFDSGKLPEPAMRRLILASPERVGHNLAWLKAELKRRGLKAPLWVTEFNYMSADYATSWKYGEDPIQGALVASLLIEFAKHGVEGACYWSLIGNHNFGMVKSAEHRQMRPAGFLYLHLKALRGARVLRTDYDPGPDDPDDQPVEFTVSGLDWVTYDRDGVLDLAPEDPWWRDHEKIRPVTALGLEKDGRHYLLIVNRSLEQTAMINCRGADIIESRNPLSLLFEPETRAEYGSVTLPPAQARLIEYRRQ